jgi:LuxR family maltose regulon positive regulatory protein
VPSPTHARSLLDSKLEPPAAQAGSVARTALVNRLRAASGAPVISIVAPAGYGKTTLLGQWARRDSRPFAWVSLDAQDDDPRKLFAYVAEALAASGAFDSSAPSYRGSAWAAALSRLVAWLAGASQSFTLVLDGADHLQSPECTELVGAVARNLPAGSRLALAGRRAPALAPRLRAHGLLLEFGRADLALSARESRLLLEAAGFAATPEDAVGLTQKTEGWPAGLYLAALSLQDRQGSAGSVGSFGGDDRFVTDYLWQEHLSRLSPKTLRFLVRSSVLRQMSAPLCDAVLDRRDSARELQALERADLFLVPLDHRRECFRYHHLFRESLLAELARSEPELVPELNRRAADWCEREGLLDAAIDYADAAGDSERMADLVGAAAVPGRAWNANLERWLGRLDDPDLLARHPAAAVVGSWHHALRGRPVDAWRWAEAAEHTTAATALPDGCATVEPWLAVLRASRCPRGVGQMRIDADAALAALPASSPWRASALVQLGAAALLAGDDSMADAAFADAAESAFAASDQATAMLALAERSLLAASRDDYAAAVDFAEEARSVAETLEFGGDALKTVKYAASARAALRCGNGERVRDDLARAKALLPLLTQALPWFSVQVDLELARTYLALGDLDGATALLNAADEILRRVPDLGVLPDIAASLHARAATLAASTDRAGSGLTAAELRLLPHLTTHLSFREIGERLFVSRNTVKTQAISVYRKLGVSSRSEAITQAAELGLVDDLHQLDYSRTA